MKNGSRLFFKCGHSFAGILLALAFAARLTMPAAGADWLKRWTIEQGLASNTITALLQNRQGYLWLATPSGLVRFDGLQFRCFNRWNTPVMNVDRLTCLWLDDDDTMWIGSDGGGLYQLRADRWRVFKQELSNPHVQTVMRDRRGALWVGTQYGLNRLQNQGGETYTMSQGLPGNLVYALAEAEDGTLLAGTDGDGLAVLRGRRFAVTDRVDPPVGIHSLRRGQDGRVRIAAENGFFTWHGGTLLRHHAVSRQTSLLALLEDRAGRWWLGSEGEGLFLLADDRLSAQPGAGSTYRYVSSLLEDHEGNVWFGSIGQGLAQLQASTSGPPAQPLALQIETVLADNRPISGQSGVVLPRTTRLLEFHFTAVAFRHLERLRLQYRLLGLETDWHSIPGHAPRIAFYSNLKPGSYTFQIRLENVDRRQPAEYAPAEFSFRLKSPSWLGQGAVLLLAALCVMAFVFLTRQRRSRRRRARATPASMPGSRGETAAAAQKKYATSALTAAVAAEMEQRLLALMEKEAAWLDPDLTLKKLADMLRIHPNYLSQIINERLGRKARDFINAYRIAAAEKMLLDPRLKDKTVLDIAYETGFYSKSVFNSAFKKFNGQSPQEYRKGKS